MKTCVCFYGLPHRSLKFTLENVKRTVVFGTPDVYIHTFDTTVAQSIRANEQPTPIDPQDILKLNPTKFRIDSEEDFNSSFNFKKYEDFGNPFPDEPGTSQTIHNLLRELHSIQQVWKMIPDPMVYDRVIMTRADLLFSQPLDFECPANTLLTSTRPGLPYHNDFFAMGSPGSLDSWANRIDHAEAFCEWSAHNRHMVCHPGIHPETLVTYILHRFKLNHTFIDVSPCRVRSTGKIER